MGGIAALVVIIFGICYIICWLRSESAEEEEENVFYSALSQG